MYLDDIFQMAIEINARLCVLDAVQLKDDPKFETDMIKDCHKFSEALVQELINYRCDKACQAGGAILKRSPKMIVQDAISYLEHTPSTNSSDNYDAIGILKIAERLLTPQIVKG